MMCKAAIMAYRGTPRQFTEGTKRLHEKNLRMSGVPAEIQTEYLQNKRLGGYFYTNRSPCPFKQPSPENTKLN
jgi:hypothetical protein